MAIDLGDTRIDAGAAKYRWMLRNLQGGILKSHGRDHVLLLVFRFTAAPDAIRAWMADFARRHLTSMLRQLEEARRFQEREERGHVFGSLFLAAEAYKALGLSDQDLAASFPERPEERPGVETRALWRDGMEAAAGELNDPALEPPYAGRQVHGMVLLADDLPSRLERARRQVETRLSQVAEILTVETGRVLRDGDGESIEPFGYRDGLSQPLFLQQDLEAAEQSHGGAFRAWNPEAPLGLVLAPDRLTRQPDAFGSYLVFRKLEQDVKGFRERLAALAAHAGHGSAELAGAMAVGRFEDGTPVLASATPQAAPGNDFNYLDSDSSSHSYRRCPFHAHIRKINPRGESVPSTSESPDEERSRRIVRRGVPYEEIDPPKTGLLFLCFQSDISQQFAFLQKNWANNPSFATNATGRDPLIGRPTSGVGSQQRWPVAWSSTAFPRLFSLLDFVHLQGGEFFFAPSIPFLLGR